MREAVLADLVFEELLFCAKFFGFIDKGEEGELRVLESLFHVIGPWEVILPVLLVGGIQNEEVNVGELFFIEIRGMMGANTFKGIEEFIES